MHGSELFGPEFWAPYASQRGSRGDKGYGKMQYTLEGKQYEHTEEAEYIPGDKIY